MNNFWLKSFGGILMAAVIATPAVAAPVATVNGAVIEANEISKEYSSLNALQKERINKDAGTRREIVEGAVNAELLAQAAKKSGIENEEEYKTAVEKFKKQFLATRYLQKNIENKISNSAVKAFFEKNKGNYDTTQVRAMHILVNDQSAVDKLLTAAKASKTDKQFGELAKKNSMDPTVSENNGDLGYFTRDRMVPEFATAAFSMKKGEIKGPIKSMYGYHIIKLVDIKYGRVPNFDEVETKVREDFRSSLAQEAVGKLRTEAKININDEAINSLRF